MHRLLPRFFVTISTAILAIVLTGFARTLYLRGLFGPPPIPVHLYVHGALLTAWFALVVTQTTLVRRRAVAAHRRLGLAGVGVGAALVVTSAIVTLRFAGRVMHAPTAADVSLSVAMGFGPDAPLVRLAAIALWGNLTSLAVFAVLLGGAVALRRRSHVHKRLMVAASLSILPPAIARIARWPGLGGDLGPLVPVVMLLLVSAMVGFDLYTRRRVHGATLVGVGLVALGFLASGFIAGSDIGQSVLGHLE